ncbi:MAG TPA: alkylmercury lyase family protein [Jatrophihabitantaceae bacterium]|nr:alkylmercury lyase family protein [Jatrophihabitantaceae bacterium]
MRLQLLYVADCPNAPVLLARLREVGAGPIEELVVRDPDEAATAAMTGSPTLLVGGVDPFATPGETPSLSCRLYRDEIGTPAGVPSVAQLRAVLGEQVSTSKWRAEGTGARQAALPRRLRQLHQKLLMHFLDRGAPPSRDWLDERATELGLDPDPAVTRLAAEDLVHIDEGTVSVAYPFSGVARGHRVELGGTRVEAMCAIDALGVPQLAARNATITATDPPSGQRVRVEVRGGEWQWTPASTVVLVAGTTGTGTSAACTCGHVNFYSHAEQAWAYLGVHPDLVGRVLDQPTAVELAGAVFGGLLPPKIKRIRRMR